MVGVVYKSTGNWYWVKSEGIFYKCRIKGTFRLKNIKSTNPIVVGDTVGFLLETQNNEKTGVITTLYERTNYIVRKSVNLSKQTHIIAANIDQVFLLITIDNPPILTTFIDRFLVTTYAYSIKTILIFNKMDSYNQEQQAKIVSLKTIYKKIGYPCVEISAIKNKNIAIIKTLMHNKVSMFIGHSGVGKSTLINTLEPSLDLKTQDISTQHKQGQHTTTFSQMFDLSFNAKIIDTPGIKGFGVVDMDKDEIDDYFPEFFSVKNQCRFNNCMHLHEPDCAVKKALKNKEISESRYKSYLQIIQDKQKQYRTDIWKR